MFLSNVPVFVNGVKKSLTDTWKLARVENQFETDVKSIFSQFHCIYFNVFTCERIFAEEKTNLDGMTSQERSKAIADCIEYLKECVDVAIKNHVKIQTFKARRMAHQGKSQEKIVQFIQADNEKYWYLTGLSVGIADNSIFRIVDSETLPRYTEQMDISQRSHMDLPSLEVDDEEKENEIVYVKIGDVEIPLTRKENATMEEKRRMYSIQLQNRHPVAKRMLKGYTGHNFV